MEQITAGDMLKMIEDMNNEDKQKFLDLLFKQYFVGGGGRRHVIEK
ncbi:hypothetical protein [Psychrobacillus psychrotolerans]